MELSEEIRSFILPESDQVEMYSHRTSSMEVAQKINDEGFRFSNSFQKTTDQIIDDMVYLRYWDSMRKHYGSFVVIIGISKKVIEKVQKIIEPKLELQQALSKTLQIGENSDENIYLLPSEFVKGYVERENGKLHPNENYNPEFLPLEYKS